MGYAGLPFDADVFVNFKTRCDTFSDPEDMCFTHYEGDIIIFEDEDDTHESPITVGAIRALVVNFSEMLAAKCSLSEVFDFEECLGDFHEALTEEGGDSFKDSLFEKYAFGNWSSLLIIERVEIKSEHRGRGLGLLACETTCCHIGSGCDIVALKVFPLQLEPSYERNSGSERVMLEGFSTDKAEATAGLQNYYMLMGFEELAPDILVRSPTKL